VVRGSQPPLFSVTTPCRVEHHQDRLVIDHSHDERPLAPFGVVMPTERQPADSLDCVPDLLRQNSVLVSELFGDAMADL